MKQYSSTIVVGWACFLCINVEHIGQNTRWADIIRTFDAVGRGIGHHGSNGRVGAGVGT